MLYQHGLRVLLFCYLIAGTEITSNVPKAWFLALVENRQEGKGNGIPNLLLFSLLFSGIYLEHPSSYNPGKTREEVERDDRQDTNRLSPLPKAFSFKSCLLSSYSFAIKGFASF